MSVTIPPGEKAILLCADDFGLAPGICDGILALARVGRLSGTGCMMPATAVSDFAAPLRELTGSIDAGIHITLTDLAPLGSCPRLAPGGQLPTFSALARAALSGRLATAEIVVEIDRQFDLFERLFGRAPAFIDGHHHIHQLPGIRDIVIDRIATRFAGRLPVLRVCDDSPARILARGVTPLRALAIGLLGPGLRRRARAAGIPTNQAFSGIYDFSGAVSYATLFDRFLAGLPGNAIVVCHPGHVDDTLRAVDSLMDQRERELEFFLSDAFLVSLRRHGMTVGRFSNLAQKTA